MMKQKILIISAVILIIVLAACSKISGKSNSSDDDTREINKEKTTEVKNPAEDVPTVFFHGYKGTKGSFKGMMSRLSKNQGAHLGEILEVSPDGNVKTQKEYDLKKKKLLIQVLFEDNQSNDVNQAQWIENTLEFIANQGFSKVNIVGHSMGGVSGLRYLITMTPKENMKVEKFVSIGAPFDGFEELASGESIEDVLQNGPRNKDSRYGDYSQWLEKFPKTLPWLNIVGLLNEKDPNKGDGTVPLSSSLALTAGAKNLGLNYTNQTFKAQHSELHDNKEVDQALSNFLWNEKQQ